MSLGRSVGLGLALTKVSAAVVTVWPPAWPPAASTDVASTALPSQQELPVCAW